jgi:DNA-binding protein HU-beta
MANALTKSQIASEIAEKNSITKKQAVEILEHLATLAYKHAKPK